MSAATAPEMSFPPHRPVAGLRKDPSMQQLLSRQGGQATAEYALVIIAAAAVALALITWATNTDVLASLFDAAVERVRRFMP